MSGTLIFDAPSIANLILHASKAGKHTPTWGQMLEEGARRQGKTPDDFDIATEWDGLVRDAKDFDPGPALRFVKDQGIYLMSNGIPDLPTDDPDRVIYAEGFNPKTADFDDWWDNARAIVGGDDFVENLPIASDNIVAALDLTNGKWKPNHFFLKVSPTTLEWGFE